MTLTPDQQMALAWLADQSIGSGDVAGVLDGLYTDAYLAGTKSAVDQLGGAIISTDLSQAVTSINWDTWKPGHARAAAKVAADDHSSGLARLLADADITINGIEGTRLDNLARVLADALANGDSVDTLAGALSDLTSSTAQAELIAVTETARAMSAASIDLYRANGADGFDVLLGSNPCAVCEDEAQNNPHSLGDDPPPYHPRCQCAVAGSFTVPSPDGDTSQEDQP